MSNAARTLIAVVALLLLGFALNPSAERHREKIAASIASNNQLAGVLGVGKLTAFVSTYHSLGLASYATVNDRAVSIGALGVVIVIH